MRGACCCLFDRRSSPPPPHPPFPCFRGGCCIPPDEQRSFGLDFTDTERGWVGGRDAELRSFRRCEIPTKFLSPGRNPLEGPVPSRTAVLSVKVGASGSLCFLSPFLFLVCSRYSIEVLLCCSHFCAPPPPASRRFATFVWGWGGGKDFLFSFPPLPSPSSSSHHRHHR